MGMLECIGALQEYDECVKEIQLRMSECIRVLQKYDQNLVMSHQLADRQKRAEKSTGKVVTAELLISARLSNTFYRDRRDRNFVKLNCQTATLHGAIYTSWHIFRGHIFRGHIILKMT